MREQERKKDLMSELQFKRVKERQQKMRKRERERDRHDGKGYSNTLKVKS